MTSWHAYQVSPSLKGKFKQLTLQYCYVFVQYFSEIASLKRIFSQSRRRIVPFDINYAFQVQFETLWIDVRHLLIWSGSIDKKNQRIFSQRRAVTLLPTKVHRWMIQGHGKVTFVTFVTLQQRRRAYTVFFGLYSDLFVTKKWALWISLLSVVLSDRRLVDE